MEYAALFLWLGMCLVLGALIHSITAGALQYRPVRLLAGPGVVVRKLTMGLVALLAGARITQADIYQLSERDIEFEAEGPAGPARVLAPLAPLFGCALALTLLNRLASRPLQLSHSVPSFVALDVQGLKGFFTATWELLANAVKQFSRQGWRAPLTYLFLALTFSLALGGASPLDRLKEAGLGAGLVAVGLALVAALSGRHVDGAVTHPLWFTATRDGLLSTSAAAFVMMVYGLLTAVMVGILVRAYEIMAHRGATAAGRRTRIVRDEEHRRAA